MMSNACLQLPTDLDGDLVTEAAGVVTRSPAPVATSPPDPVLAVNPCLHGAIRDADSLTMFGAGAPFPLPISLFHVLMAFAEPKPVSHAFAELAAELSIDDFRALVDELAARDLLRPHQPLVESPGLPHVLSPSVMACPATLGRLASALQQGRAVLIPDALPADLAETAYRDLHRSKQWSAAEGAHDYFHYRNCILPRLDEHGPALSACHRIFQSPASRRFVAELSGQDCSGAPSTAAAWYRVNEYALPHDDTTSHEPRSVAFIWYLTKNWQPEWGGTLFWCPTGQFITPRFNTLLMFRVTPANVHFISPVSPCADQKRLTINGFWNRAHPRPQLAPPSPHPFVSPQAYGAPSPDPLSLGPLVVL